jgi:hypothetical protein
MVVAEWKRVSAETGADIDFSLSFAEEATMSDSKPNFGSPGDLSSGDHLGSANWDDLKTRLMIIRTEAQLLSAWIQWRLKAMESQLEPFVTPGSAKGYRRACQNQPADETEVG